MAIQSDLMTIGLAAAVASRLGYNPITLTTTGTSSGTAATIASKMVSLNTASSQTGAILPVSVGDIFFIGCPTATTGIVYPPSGATINGGSSMSVAQNKAAIIWSQSATVLFGVLLA